MPALVPEGQQAQEHRGESSILPVFSLRPEKPGNTERAKMNNLLLRLYVKFQDLKNHAEGQDLVEYALAVALMSLGAAAGMGALAQGVNTAFYKVSTQLGASIT
jgi:Flp pilus assembly pilin Flp